MNWRPLTPFVTIALVALSSPGVRAAGPIVFSANPLLFGNVPMGTSQQRVLTVTNTGPTALTLTGIYTGASVFSVVSPVELPFVLEPDASQSLTVTCTPTYPGTVNSMLSVIGDQSSANANLSCTGAAADITLLTPDSIDFEQVTVGATSGGASVTVGNAGNIELTVSGGIFFGTHADQFIRTGPALPAPIPPTGSLTWQVRCRPTSTGPKSATFTLFSNDADQDTTEISLSCTGTDPAADLSVDVSDGGGPATAGQPIVYTIVVTNDGPEGVADALVSDAFPDSITAVTWTCLSAGAASCTSGGSGDIADSVSLPVGGSATYTVTGTVGIAASGPIVNTATIALPAGFSDPDPTDNSSQVATAVTGSDLLFKDGFET